MKEKYRAMLQNLLERMQEQELIECKISEIADCFKRAAVKIAELSKAIQLFGDTFAQYAYAIAHAQEMDEIGRRIEKEYAAGNWENQESNDFPEPPSIEELFKQLREAACDYEKIEIRQPIDHDWPNVPRKIMPHKAYNMPRVISNRHRARDMLPN